MSVVLRCVEITGKLVDIVEHFVGFLFIDDCSGIDSAYAFFSDLNNSARQSVTVVVKAITTGSIRKVATKAYRHEFCS